MSGPWLLQPCIFQGICHYQEQSNVFDIPEWFGKLLCRLVMNTEKAHSRKQNGSSTNILMDLQMFGLNLEMKWLHGSSITLLSDYTCG